MFKIKFHSVIDVITNSSTEIYSWYDESVGACKEMLAEMLKAFGVDKQVDDIFSVTIGYDQYVYSDYLDNLDEEDAKTQCPNYPEDWKEQSAFLKALIEKVQSGEIEKPEWMTKAEEKEDYDSGRTPTNDFIIIAKSPEYKELAKKIETFIYSPNNDAFYNG